MIEENTTQEQADAEKAMHTTALRLGYCGPRVNLLCFFTSIKFNLRLTGLCVIQVRA
jgi:hypothetical protein